MQRLDSERDACFVKVCDSRNREVRGLWKRNSLYYARLRVAGHRSAVRVPLHGAETVPQAVMAMQALKVKKLAGTLPQIRQASTLREAIASYQRYYSKVTGSKRASSLKREQCCFTHWLEYQPDIRLTLIDARFAHAFAEWRQSDGASGRAVDLDVIALRNVLKMAVRDGDLAVMPAIKWLRLAGKPKAVRLLTAEEIEAVCHGAQGQIYGEMFGHFLRLLSYCGGRLQETLRLRWEDVSFDQRQLTIGRPVTVNGTVMRSKSGEWRAVDFSPALEKHLKAMAKRKQPDSEWLFPSPRPRGRDVPVFNFNKALALAIKAAGVETFGFHHLRHYFISKCVMAGIDFMTIAKWVSHKDGGVLIGKVYGHLENAHMAKQAKKLRL